jgi:hypothetical protein
MDCPLDFNTVADKLVELYAEPFGGKPSGRYRIAAKLLRQLFGCRRLYEDDVRMLTRALAQRGYVLVDMDAFFVVMAANTFVNYRRANEDSVS